MKRINTKDMKNGWYKVWRNDSDPTVPRVFVNVKPAPPDRIQKSRFVVRLVVPGKPEVHAEFINMKPALSYANQLRLRLGIARGWGVWIYDPNTTLVQKLSLQ